MKGSVHKNHVLACLIWLLAAFVYWQALKIPVLKTDLSLVDASFFPKIIAVLLAFLAAFVFFRASKEPENYLRFRLAPELAYVLLFSALILAYIVLLPYCGFESSSIAFLIAGMWLLGMRRPLLLLTVPVGITALVYLIFIRIMHVPLPISTRFL